MGGVILTQPLGSSVRDPVKEIIIVDNVIKNSNRFTLLRIPLPGEILYMNGLKIKNGSDKDYIINGNRVDVNPLWELHLEDTFEIIYYEG